MRETRPGGTLRRHPRGGFVDPVTGRYLEIWNEGVLPSDDPLEGMRQWNVYYTVSEDGGRTHGGVRQVIHAGRDTTILPSEGEQLAAEVPHSELVIYEDAVHVCHNRHYLMRPLAADWLAEKLGA